MGEDKEEELLNLTVRELVDLLDEGEIASWTEGDVTVAVGAGDGAAELSALMYGFTEARSDAEDDDHEEE